MHFSLFLDNIIHLWGWEIFGLGKRERLVAAWVWCFIFHCFDWRDNKMDPELRFLEVRCQYCLIYRNHHAVVLMEGVEWVSWHAGLQLWLNILNKKHPKASFIAGESIEKSDLSVFYHEVPRVYGTSWESRGSEKQKRILWDSKCVSTQADVVA